MATNKKAAAEAEVKEEVKEEIEETVKEEVTETEEIAETVSEETAEETVQAEETTETEEQPVKVSSKRIKKIERREAKAARKAANKIEEKKSRPNNLLIGLLIFGVVVGMFAFVLGYNYFSKPATIAKYIEKNGGAESFEGMQIDQYTTADVTADGNSMTISFKAETDDKDAAAQIKEYYSGDDGKEMLEYYAEQMLTSIKPQTRAFSADVKAVFTLNGKEINSVEMTYKEAKEKMEEAQKEAEEAAEEADADADADDADSDAADKDAAEESGDAAEESAED